MIDEIFGYPVREVEKDYLRGLDGLYRDIEYEYLWPVINGHIWVKGFTTKKVCETIILDDWSRWAGTDNGN